ncbi:DUF4436 family protein [Antrihabitans sp. YC2-6]|uniref:DUF4436 family protein n=1 Tax=Antrihabitans sp. YC2-6 TaxID=2799498 RepID=UPI0035A884A3
MAAGQQPAEKRASRRRPPGSRVDRTVMIWALIGLVAAKMTTYVVAWWRHRESQAPCWTVSAGICSDPPTR